jgi:hypothetical protein
VTYPDPLRPLTPKEAEDAYNATEPIPLPEERIREIVDYATGRTDRLPSERRTPAMTERDAALALAHRILDRPRADPDDDLALLSRQLLRALERITALEVDLGEAVAALEPFAFEVAKEQENLVFPINCGGWQLLAASRVVRKTKGGPP